MSTMDQSQMKSGKPKGTAEDFNQVGAVIAVMSGKGGVGKSFVTGLLASGLARSGYKVGVMDADITGPSIPKLFGLHGPVNVGEFGILPLESRTGIKVISMNLLLSEEDKPVIWRGPLVSRAIQQLWGDVMWGDLDVLLIDLPPGTSDATLTIMQSLPVHGLVMVTTPQSLASLVVRKAVHMAQIVDVNIIGIVENMAYFICPDTGKKYPIFGESHSLEVATEAGAPIISIIPIDPNVSRLCDEGNVELVNLENSKAIINAFIMAAKIPVKEGFESPLTIDEGSLSQVSANAEQQIDKDKSQGVTADLANYSPEAQRIILTKENMGYIENPDLSGKFRGCCGDSIQMDILMDGETIIDARYTTDGCFATMACGGMVTRMIKGKSLTKAMEITSQDLKSALGGLPKGHIHCADLAIKTLHSVLSGENEVSSLG